VQPAAASQPSKVQSLPSLQTLMLPAAHLPSLQLSPSVQALSSASQLAPSSGVAWQTWSVQETLVHGLSSSQSASSVQGQS